MASVGIDEIKKKLDEHITIRERVDPFVKPYSID